MNPVRTTRAARRRRQTRRWLVVASALIAVAAITVIAYLWYPTTNTVSNDTSGPTGFKIFTDHYLTIMKNLSSTETKTKIVAQLNPKYNQTDLFTWEHGRLTFVQDTAGFFEDPTQILNSGKGICVQWSILYVSACLALNHPSRLAVAVDTSTWHFIHTWAEDYFNGSWVHVDPSDSVWNNPSRYQSWDWGNALGSGVKVYAFEYDGFEEVTSSYVPHSN
jgi:Transglutaminase-like superfamily